MKEYGKNSLDGVKITKYKSWPQPKQCYKWEEKQSKKLQLNMQKKRNPKSEFQHVDHEHNPGKVIPIKINPKKTLPDGTVVDFTDVMNCVLNLDKLIFVTEDLLKQLGFIKTIDWIFKHKGQLLFVTKMIDNKYIVCLADSDFIVSKTPQELKMLIESIKKYNL